MIDYRCSIVEALEAASLYPAEALGLQDQKGSLKPGADAEEVSGRIGLAAGDV